MSGLFDFLPKGTLNLKHLRRSPLMFVLAAVMMCSIYMSFDCLKKTEIYIDPQSTKTEPLDRYSHVSIIVGLNQGKIQGNPDLMITKPVKERSNDPIVLGLNQMKPHINQEFPIEQPSTNSYDPGILDLEQPAARNQKLTRTGPMEEKNSYDPIIVDTEKQRTQEIAESRRIPIEEKLSYESNTVILEQSVINENPGFARTKPKVGEHSFDHHIVGLKQADIQTKSKIVSNYPSVQHSHDSRVIRFNQSKIQTKPEPVMMKPIELNSYNHRIAGLKQTKVSVEPQLARTNSTDPKITDLNVRRMRVQPEFVRTDTTQPSCPDPGIAQSEIPCIHYPVPTSYSRGECACTPVRFYVIISMQRSGSKWLETLLNSHINVSSNGEIFIESERRENSSVLTRTLDKVYNLEWRYGSKKKACIAAVGFKWMLNQGILKNYEEVHKYFKRRGVLVIFLFRRNLLRRIISSVANAKDRSQVNGTHKAHVSTQQEAEILASYKPKLSPKLLVSRLKGDSRRATESVEHFKSIRHIVLYYEDLVQNTTEEPLKGPRMSNVEAASNQKQAEDG